MTKNSSLKNLRGSLKMVVPKQILYGMATNFLSNKGKVVDEFKRRYINATSGTQALPEKEARAFIDSQQQAGYIIAENNFYILNFTLQGSDVRLNGQSIYTDFLLNAIR
jgi:hypothetical protein